MVDARATTLIPGTPIPPPFPLARYRYNYLSGVVGALVRSATQPGDLVLAVGACAGATIAEVVNADRRLIVLNRNPIEQLCIRLDLHRVPISQVQTALTQLGDLSKTGRPLMAHIKAQYASRCPNCNAQGTAEWFAWDRDAAQPFAKQVACRRCGASHEGPADEEDIASAGDFPIRGGPAYHLALSRAAAQDGPTHERVAELVQLYTLRNLTALMDIAYRLPQLHVPQDVQRVIAALVLEALDRCSSLTAYHAPGEKPRSLRPPQRFLEVNVWTALEQALQAYARDYVASARAAPGIAATGAASLSALQATPEPGYLLLGRSIQDLDTDLLEGSARAVIWEVRPPDAPFWALSILWASWLWGDDLPTGLRGFLRRRRLDWDWYRRSLETALHQLRPILEAEAPVLIVTASQSPAPVRAVIDGASRAGLAMDRWIACPPVGYRLLLRYSDVESSVPDEPEAGDASQARSRAWAQRVLSQRGEPTDRQELEGIGVIESRDPDLPELVVPEAANLVAVSARHIWLRSDHRTEDPLADRVEERLLDLLRARSHWLVEDLTAELYATFGGSVSPEPEFITACIAAYTEADAAGLLTLRTEDEPARRRSEMQQMRSLVQALGERLGYDVSRRLGGDIVWKEERQESYLFRCTTTAVLGPHLLKPPPACDGQRCLIIPGGRAALVALKLRRDPRLSALARENRWAFVKYRHLRRMVESIHGRADIEVFLGLDPIVEQSSAQLSLPLGFESRQ